LKSSFNDVLFLEYENFKQNFKHFNLIIHNKKNEHKNFKKQERKKKVKKTLRFFKKSQNLKSKIDLEKISILVLVLE
jgi:hypothetical protein